MDNGNLLLTHLPLLTVQCCGATNFLKHSVACQLYLDSEASAEGILAARLYRR